MEIRYTGDFVDDRNIAKKIQDRLHRIFGLSQVGGYFWRKSVDDDKYGYQNTEVSKTVYTVTIDNKNAFTTTYLSDANAAVNEMIENDFEAGMKETTTIDRFEEWRDVNGRYFFIQSENKNIVGRFSVSPYPCLKYEGSVTMTTTFVHEYGDFVLNFLISFEAEEIKDRKKAEKMLVDVPLEDMRYIRNAIESTLNLELRLPDSELEHIIECTGCIKSESTHECSSETIGMVMADE